MGRAVKKEPNSSTSLVEGVLITELFLIACPDANPLSQITVYKCRKGDLATV